MSCDTTLSPPSSSQIDLAPVVVFTYTRVDHFVRTIESLRNNHLAHATMLYVVSDGPKHDAHAPFVKGIRDYTDNLTGFGEIVRLYREKNLGPDLSPRLAQEQVLSDHGKAVIMEDDNISSRNFLNFINQGLDYFKDNPNVLSICGYRPAIDQTIRDDDADFFFYPWNVSWGFGVWKKKIDALGPLLNNYPEYRRDNLLNRQNLSGGLYISDSLRRDYYKQKRFPDAVLCTEMFKNGLHAVLPTRSKIHNIGLDGSGQSSKKVMSKFDVVLDDGKKVDFDFSAESRKSPQYSRAISATFNGRKSTQLLRRLGLYHRAAEISSKLARIVHSGK
jgi:hypothetical protein